MPAVPLWLLSSAIVPATPATPQPWFDFMEDYPMKAFDNRWEGVTEFELLVAPDGSVAKCTVLQSAGQKVLDDKTCLLAQKRVRFHPARDADGRPVWGTFRNEMKWALPQHQLPSRVGPDLEISVSALPVGVTLPPAVKLAYSVDPQGNTSGCTVLPSSLKQPSALVEIGCKELLRRESGKAVLGPSGTPVPAVKTAAVLFKAGG